MFKSLKYFETKSKTLLLKAVLVFIQLQSAAKCHLNAIRKEVSIQDPYFAV